MGDWEITAGRCGACLKFVRDYGSGPKTYGHCGVKPRAGSITPSMYKCDVYVPRPEVAPAAAQPASIQRPRPKVDPFEATAATAYRSPSPTPVAPDRAREELIRRERSAQRDNESIELTWGNTPVSQGQDSPPQARSEQTGSEGKMNRGELRELLREAIDDILGIGTAEPLDRFKGGKIIVRPGTPGTQDKEFPIDALLHKVVMIRDNLRVLEQKINSHAGLDDADRVAFQHYVTRCYGSLTTFNSLFKHREDWFRGSGQGD